MRGMMLLLAAIGIICAGVLLFAAICPPPYTAPVFIRAACGVEAAIVAGFAAWCVCSENQHKKQ